MAAGFGLVLAMRYPLNTALTVAARLAQIGEFSFILAALAVSLGLMPQEGMSLVLAGALISMALNPFIFRAIAPVCAWVLARSAFARSLENRGAPDAELPASTDRRARVAALRPACARLTARALAPRLPSGSTTTAQALHGLHQPPTA